MQNQIENQDGEQKRHILYDGNQGSECIQERTICIYKDGNLNQDGGKKHMESQDNLTLDFIPIWINKQNHTI